MQIDFNDQTNEMPADYIDLLDRLLKYAAKEEGVSPEAEVSVNFVNNKEIQELNRDYRGINEPTDVISFAMQEQVEDEPEIILEQFPLLLGDIVVSLERAKEQAEEYGHSLKREIAFLTIHGFLHLLGYDHEKEADEKKMFARQNDILSEFGIER